MKAISSCITSQSHIHQIEADPRKIEMITLLLLVSLLGLISADGLADDVIMDLVTPDVVLKNVSGRRRWSHFYTGHILF